MQRRVSMTAPSMATGRRRADDGVHPLGGGDVRLARAPSDPRNPGPWILFRGPDCSVYYGVSYEGTPDPGLRVSSLSRPQVSGQRRRGRERLADCPVRCAASSDAPARSYSTTNAVYLRSAPGP